MSVAESVEGDKQESVAEDKPTTAATDTCQWQCTLVPGDVGRAAAARVAAQAQARGRYYNF